mmetsp:Transcript_2728/g.7830  ORF Transcript_2728/g.7830 Transcript_2728/m.7830 type:complete len:270 (+) Transcript_2728:109-918(+)
MHVGRKCAPEIASQVHHLRASQLGSSYGGRGAPLRAASAEPAQSDADLEIALVLRREAHLGRPRAPSRPCRGRAKQSDFAKLLDLLLPWPGMVQKPQEERLRVVRIQDVSEATVVRPLTTDEMPEALCGTCDRQALDDTDIHDHGVIPRHAADRALGRDALLKQRLRFKISPAAGFAHEALGEFRYWKVNLRVAFGILPDAHEMVQRSTNVDVRHVVHLYFDALAHRVPQPLHEGARLQLPRCDARLKSALPAIAFEEAQQIRALQPLA